MIEIEKIVKPNIIGELLIFKVGLSTSKKCFEKIRFICFNESQLKTMK